MARTATQQFTATAYDQFGATMRRNPTFNWAVATGVGSINSSSGLYTASYASGTATVTAVRRRPCTSNAAAVTVTDAAPTVATPAAASAQPVTGTTTSLSVLGADSDGGGEANLTYTWATTGTPPAAVNFLPNSSNAAKNSTATFTKAGSYSFVVTITDQGGQSTTSTVNVTVNQTVTAITISPASVKLAAGGGQKFTATAYDQFDATFNVPPVFTWSAISGSITPAGAYTAPSAAGSDTVTVAAAGKTATAAVVITGSAAPHIVSWQSIEVDGNGLGEVGLTIPDDGSFSEPRGGGIHRLLVTFDKAIDPANFTPANVRIAGNGANGASLDLSSIAITTSMRSGNTVGVIDFSPALPDVARYLVRIVGVTDPYGAALAGDNDRILTALMGDVNGDGKVDTSDGVLLKQSYAIRVNPANVNQVRSDYNSDGKVDVNDLAAMWNQRNHNATNIPDPVIAALAAAKVAAQSADSTGAVVPLSAKSAAAVVLAGMNRASSDGTNDPSARNGRRAPHMQ